MWLRAWIVILSFVLVLCALRLSSSERKEGETPSLAQTLLLDAEQAMARKERDRVAAWAERLRREGYAVHGFYHTSAWQEYWREVIAEQMYFLDGRRKFPATSSTYTTHTDTHTNTHTDTHTTHTAHTTHTDTHTDTITQPTHLSSPSSRGTDDVDFASYEWDSDSRYASLLSLSDALHVTVAGQDLKEFQEIKALLSTLLLTYKDKIHLSFNYSLIREVYDDALPGERVKFDRESDLSTGEYPTILRLHSHCQRMKREGKKALVYYLHAKGGCCWKDFRRVYISTWRDLMNTMTIEFPSLCLRALLDKNYSTCGAQNQLAHYSGNFWWANCDHIAQLSLPSNRFDWRKPEFYVLFVHNKLQIREKFGFRCGYSTYNSGKNLYRHECPRAQYRQVLWDNVWNDTIARSAGKDALVDESLQHVCKALRERHETMGELDSELRKYFG